MNFFWGPENSAYEKWGSEKIEKNNAIWLIAHPQKTEIETHKPYHYGPPKMGIVSPEVFW